MVKKTFIFTATLGLAFLCVLIAILVVTSITLNKVNKNNNSDNDNDNGNSNNNTNTNTTTNQDCMKKSTLPLASDPSAYDPFKWGSYRGQLYFGMQTRHRLSPKFGIMWKNNDYQMRYWCNNNPTDVVKFMWINADFESFGEQNINDHNLNFKTLWINNNHSFSAKITVDNTTKTGNYSMYLYFAFQDESSFFKHAEYSSKTGMVKKLTGTFAPLGDFEVTISTIGVLRHSEGYLGDTPYVEMATVESFIQRFQKCNSSKNNCFLDPTVSLLPYSNLFVLQNDFNDSKYSIQFNFKIKNDTDLQEFDTTFDARKTDFNKKFDKTFPIPENDTAKDYIDMGKAGLSNMLGSISYWYGYSNATGSCLSNGDTVEYGPLELTAGEPSRPDFPRGFLWDDGFHNLLIRQFDPDLSLQIISSWLDTMNTYGWIPREMFLTKEAQAKVPPGPWLIEKDNVANPPMLIYVVSKFISDDNVMNKYKDKILKLYPRLKLYYTWMKNIQKGPVKGSFQWQGRYIGDTELNPATLPSGMDDFPRATHPSKDEYHLDIKCWMAMSSTIILKLSKLTNDTGFLPTIEKDEKLFNDLTLLDQLHWSNLTNGYYDYGNHSYDVILVNETRNGIYQEYRHTVVEPKLRHVDDVFGYVNIFPFLMKLIPANSSKIDIILDNITNPECLWTNYGLRSIATVINGNKSRYYDAYNNIFNAPYWRGPIWINLNYLALDALNYYSQQNGPYKDRCNQVYIDLRTNVIENMGRVYKDTGFIWEHYDDKTGDGAGTRPFTGWSALVLAIMGNDYR